MSGIDWVIVGGESGGARADARGVVISIRGRPMRTRAGRSSSSVGGVRNTRQVACFVEDDSEMREGVQWACWPDASQHSSDALVYCDLFAHTGSRTAIRRARHPLSSLWPTADAAAGKHIDHRPGRLGRACSRRMRRTEVHYRHVLELSARAAEFSGCSSARLEQIQTLPICGVSSPTDRP